MYFKNEKHRQAFEDGIKKANKKDKETLCLIYLLSADSSALSLKFYLKKSYKGVVFVLSDRWQVPR